MRIGIFCSSKSDIDPDFFTLTEELGHWMGSNGHTAVFGGADLGLMECVAQAVHKGGGTTVGVVPTILAERGRVSQCVDVEFPCDTLGERKEIMIAQSDVLIALPGGVGTVDEIFSTVASNTIGYHRKRVILYDMKGFWQPVVDLMKHLADTGMVAPDYSRLIAVAHSLADIQRLLED